MEVRAKKALGQHFLTDQKIARAIVDALPGGLPALEVGPGMGVLSQYLIEREDIDLRLVEIDTESVEYLLTHFAGMEGKLMEADFLRLPLEKIFPAKFNIIGNFPYNISSQIFFKVLDYKDSVPCVVGRLYRPERRREVHDGQDPVRYPDTGQRGRAGGREDSMGPAAGACPEYRRRVRPANAALVGCSDPGQLFAAKGTHAPQLLQLPLSTLTPMTEILLKKPYIAPSGHKKRQNDL